MEKREPRDDTKSAIKRRMNEGYKIAAKKMGINIPPDFGESKKSRPYTVFLRLSPIELSELEMMTQWLKKRQYGNPGRIRAALHAQFWAQARSRLPEAELLKWRQWEDDEMNAGLQNYGHET